MNKFNWDLINQPNIVVHCRTEEQAKELLTEAHKNGFKWDSKKEYSNISNYDVYLSDTCYHIYNGVYCNTECAERLYYKILKFEECKMNNKLLDVDFIIQKDNKTIVLDIKHMDESLRKCNNSILARTKDDKYIIRSNYYPALRICNLLLKGKDKIRDNEFAYYTFDTTDEMNEYIENMNKLIDEINNPIIKIDVNEDEDYEVNGYKIEISTDDDYDIIKIRKSHAFIKSFYIDDSEIEGQPFDEVVEEFDNFCKRRNINAKLVR